MTNVQYKDQEYLILLGKRIEDIRIKSGKSYEDFAIRCGLDRRQLRRIEKAETNSSISILKKIADGLNLTMSELLNFED
ncbi:helix-turn-helix domain-containing protein [Sphingobacterium bovistauri]|uniref:Helix-turn-helix transcriptional regulator n=1 Tax=Sphingobacterium bovistauri TaxID=2781959 RepID=A0ABS7Z9P3_9SPHI|nr:helix-turn-helix transcriptional regulator [Sphingobacterium bovistauri]MCA5006116.1 helix-turn-helix transcriptional regulator [Sphingobacterium bovistauri]